MNYQVIARKWRPQTFADVVGQQHVTRTLENAIATGRVAHAYIFSGARGVGKTTTARILAKALNCAKGPTPTPCNECDSCGEITAGNSLDVLEIDAASNRGIDQVRELREMVRYAPSGGRYKVVILDEAHMLTTEASNALLKTLEEPPEKVVFVMATTEPDNLADTIRSRSQHFHFRALSFAEIVAALEGIARKENLDADAGAIAVMARAADGSLRDGMSLLEQARAYCGDKITQAQVRDLLGVVPAEVLDELVGAIEARSTDRALALVHRLLSEGQNLQQFCREAIGHFRNLLIVRACGADSELVTAPAEDRARLAKAAALFSEEDLTRFFQILLNIEGDLRHKPDPRLHLEMGLLRMVNAARLGPLEELLGELSGNAAPRNASSGIVTASGTAAPPGVGKISATPPTVPSIASAMTDSARPANASTNLAPALSAPASRSAASSSGAAVAPAKTTERLSPGALTDSPRPAGDSAPFPAPAVAPCAVAAATTSFDGLDAVQVAAIKSAIVSQPQQQFLAELVDSASRWELDGEEIRLFFPTESRGLAELLQARDRMEKLRTISSRVLGQTLRVCVKLEAAPVLMSTVRAGQTARELRARFEQDPIVRAMLERFGGRISEVKRRDEV
jgi:DNA polymerase-3 subunit gamma/tau